MMQDHAAARCHNLKWQSVLIPHNLAFMLGITNAHFSFLPLSSEVVFTWCLSPNGPPHFTSSLAKLLSTSGRNAAHRYKAKKKRRPQRKCPVGQPSTSRTLVSVTPADKITLMMPTHTDPNYTSCPAQAASTVTNISLFSKIFEEVWSEHKKQWHSEALLLLCILKSTFT